MHPNASPPCVRRAVTRFALTLALLSIAYALAQSPTVEVVHDPVLGTYLADPQGLTLYTHVDESADDLVCRASCLQDWRPYLLASGDPVPPDDLQGTLGILVREGNQRQVTYNDQPLYYWKDDVRRGDARGNGRDGTWHAANVQPVIRVENHPTFGAILVGPNGMTLYTFGNDRGASYRCQEACAENFPPLVVTRDPRLPPGLEGQDALVPRHENDFHPSRIQVMYKGSPLYYWSRDQQPGDVGGHGIAGLWQVAQP